MSFSDKPWKLQIKGEGQKTQQKIAKSDKLCWLIQGWQSLLTTFKHYCINIQPWSHTEHFTGLTSW